MRKVSKARVPTFAKMFGRLRLRRTQKLERNLQTSFVLQLAHLEPKREKRSAIDHIPLVAHGLRFFLNIDDLWDERNNDWKSLKEFINMLGMKTKEKRTIIIYFIPPP
jgi:hypothetical protein